jgi:DNA-binding NarL/FixJ family response regulator
MIMETKKTRIMLVDDHEVVRRGIAGLLAEHPQCEVCGEAGDGRSAVKLAQTLQPDIVIMDLGMPELNGFEATRQLRRAVPDLQVLALSMHDSEQMIREVIAAGARGYVLKTEAGAQLLEAVDALRERRPFFNSRFAAAAHDALQSAGVRKRSARGRELTRREREILQLLAEGRTNRETGEALKISVKTVETHRARIMKKLQIASVAGLVRYAIRNNMIQA